jgi:hypothetical protein
MALTATSFAVTKTDYDRNANFAHYKTYSWQKVTTGNSLWDDRVKSAVDSALKAKGWTQVPSNGDVSIAAMASTQNQQTLDTFYDGGFGRRRFGGGFGTSTTTVENNQVGNLVVDIVDTQTNKLVWRGLASSMVSNKSDKNIKNLDKSVQKMFDHFPPEPKKS